MATLGIDPGSQRHFAVLLDERRGIRQAGEISFSGSGAAVDDCLLAFPPADDRTFAVVIETPDKAAGCYSRVRGRAAGVMATLESATAMAQWFVAQGLRVYTPSANVIRQQASYNSFRCGKADVYVSEYLAQLGYKVGRGTDLSSSHRRDALMAALFNWHDPRNAQWLYKGLGR